MTTGEMLTLNTQIGSPVFNVLVNFATASQVTSSEWIATAARTELLRFVDNPNNYLLDYFHSDSPDGVEKVAVEVQFRTTEELRLINEAATAAGKSPDQFLADSCARRIKEWVDRGAPILAGAIEPPKRIPVPDTLPADWVV